MGAYILDKTKLREGRCQGTGRNYIPWIMAHETSSLGSSFITYNYKDNRDVHLLSNAEAKVFYLLLWDRNVKSIREQFVLDYESTKNIADSLGYRRPRIRMSTDFLVTVNDPIYNYNAISVKGSRSQEFGKRTVERLEIEKTYWEKRNVRYELIFADEIDPVLVKNIRSIVQVPNPKSIRTDIDAIKYLLCIRAIKVDMFKEINFKAVLLSNFKEVKRLYGILESYEKRGWDEGREAGLIRSLCQDNESRGTL